MEVCSQCSTCLFISAAAVDCSLRPGNLCREENCRLGGARDVGQTAHVAARRPRPPGRERLSCRWTAQSEVPPAGLPWVPAAGPFSMPIGRVPLRFSIRIDPSAWRSSNTCRREMSVALSSAMTNRASGPLEYLLNGPCSPMTCRPNSSGPVAGFAVDQPLVFVNANLPGIAHQISRRQLLIARRPAVRRRDQNGSIIQAKALVNNSLSYNCIIATIVPIKISGVDLHDDNDPG